MGDNATVIAWLSLAVVLVGGLLALLRYVNSEIAQERTWREEAVDEERAQREDAVKINQERILGVQRDLAAYKLEASEKFVTLAALYKFEERLEIALDKLASRQEAMISRMDTLTVDLAKRRLVPSRQDS